MESTLFNVKRKWLEDQSTVFRDVFRMPQVDSSGEAEGSSAWNPIVLPCQAAEFKQLLDVINPKYVLNDNSYDHIDSSPSGNERQLNFLHEIS